MATKEGQGAVGKGTFPLKSMTSNVHVLEATRFSYESSARAFRGLEPAHMRCNQSLTVARAAEGSTRAPAVSAQRVLHGHFCRLQPAQ